MPDGGRRVDAGSITFRHLLTHTSGLPAWRPLFRQADAESARPVPGLGGKEAYSRGQRDLDGQPA